MVVIHGNRIIEIEWAFKNNKDYVPSPKRSRKSKNKRKVKSHLGRENTAMGEGIKVDRRSEAIEFGMEITNTESPAGSKRCFADTESTRTPPKRQKRMNIVTPVVQVSSEDEYGPSAVVKKVRRMAVVV
jgi:kinesin family member 22